MTTEESIAYQPQINENIDSEEEEENKIPKSFYTRVQANIWNILEQEKPTTFGAVINVLLMLLIILNLTLMTIETEPIFSEDSNDLYFVFFHGFEIFFSLFFGWELFLRNWAAASAKKYTGDCTIKRLKYFFSFWNIIDSLSVLPSLVYIILGFTTIALPRSVVQANFSFLKDAVFIFRTLRFLRVLRIHYFFNLFGILKKVVLSKWKELLVSIFLVMTVVLFFGLFIHIFERNQDPQNFGSIPRSFYFVMITLSTIGSSKNWNDFLGYGDVVPKTWLGKMIVSICALLPIGLFGVPLTVVASGLIEELQNDNKDLHDQLKRFLGQKKKKGVNAPLTPSTPTTQSLSNLTPLQTRKNSDLSEIDELEMRNRNSISGAPSFLKNQTSSDIRPLLRLLNEDEENINFYDPKLLNTMVEYNLPMSGLFIPYSIEGFEFNMKKVKKLGGITSIQLLITYIDDNKYKIKEIPKLIKSIEKMIDFWKTNQLKFDDFKVLDIELKNNTTIKKNPKEIYKQDKDSIIEEFSKRLQNDQVNVELRSTISKKVLEKMLKDKLNVYTDLKKTTKEIIRIVLDNWFIDGELVFNEEINQMFETMYVKTLDNLPTWKKRMEKLKLNLKIN